MFSQVSVSHSVHSEIGYSWSQVPSGVGIPGPGSLPGGCAWLHVSFGGGYAWSQDPSRGWVCIVPGPFCGGRGIYHVHLPLEGTH